MLEFFQSVDTAIFSFVNHTLRNGLFDLTMPCITDLNKQPFVLVAVAVLWFILLLKGGPSGRVAALLLVPTIAFSDQLNSSVLKHLIERPRPCHALTDVHLLVPCGSGFSFPSSHAVNNFAGAIVLSYFLPRWTWAFALFAVLVAFSRVYVGVHYPSDVVAGSVIGLACGGFTIWLFNAGLSAWERISSRTRRSRTWK